MPITILCPKCNKKLAAPDALAGKRAKCPQCSQVMQLPTPVLQTAEVFEDLKSSDPLASSDPAGAGGASAAGTSSAAAPGGVGLQGLSQQQFDELLADAGPRLDVKKPKSKDNRVPCPVCHELIAQGVSQCRYCGEDFGQHLRKSSGGSSSAARKFRTCMNWLGGIWIALSLLQLGPILLGAHVAEVRDSPQAMSAESARVISMIGTLFVLVLGIATCRKAIWAVWVGLVLYYIGLIVAVVMMLVVAVLAVLAGKIAFMIGFVIGMTIVMVPLLLLMKLCHRCIYWKGQMR